MMNSIVAEQHENYVLPKLTGHVNCRTKSLNSQPAFTWSSSLQQKAFEIASAI